MLNGKHRRLSRRETDLSSGAPLVGGHFLNFPKVCAHRGFHCTQNWPTSFEAHCKRSKVFKDYWELHWRVRRLINSKKIQLGNEREQWLNASTNGRMKCRDGIFQDSRMCFQESRLLNITPENCMCFLVVASRISAKYEINAQEHLRWFPFGGRGTFKQKRL